MVVVSVIVLPLSSVPRAAGRSRSTRRCQICDFKGHHLYGYGRQDLPDCGTDERISNPLVTAKALTLTRLFRACCSHVAPSCSPTVHKIRQVRTVSAAALLTGFNNSGLSSGLPNIVNRTVA